MELADAFKPINPKQAPCPRFIDDIIRIGLDLLAVLGSGTRYLIDSVAFTRQSPQPRPRAAATSNDPAIFVVHTITHRTGSIDVALFTSQRCPVQTNAAHATTTNEMFYYSAIHRVACSYQQFDFTLHCRILAITCRDPNARLAVSARITLRGLQVFQQRLARHPTAHGTTQLLLNPVQVPAALLCSSTPRLSRHFQAKPTRLPCWGFVFP
ncbi:hypothetical protein B0H67DRAFT_70970 [Lasiosphaeris hirsuta]|uniref:Uncharacterized protein n=1 Tax=Lasiosphaeris hirsuta TaxID=260670 RepID=A0AA40EDJ7_9PEZI|nr:hypothetical protein B0H67DRAFT_70970 [Lasiosphaeris hirsuta]